MAVANLLWITLLAISALTVLLAGATIGSAAYTLQQYKDQKAQNNPWWLPIWTDHFDLNGTKSLIASGSVSLALGLVYFLALAIPRFQVAGRPKLSLAIASATAIPSVVVSVFAIAFVQVLNQKSPDVDTIESWTCRWSQTPAIAKELSVPATFTNEGFGTLCTASVRDEPLPFL
ncbi:hypothetical protein P152DRAFT_398484 [Eremomyces bilateralis CBS 781.70]|uniref:Uncharacterized protein n=1 Tax=Eremomyces bilateralis CBS 781.70 TaxID=1392243 RepID=A0A6G1G150_9PEZI|nr:uncharacterized protein P152DRAFT_398484 [Eremomyces bilateralis CBS 781.70]KAF1811763.1 hypothetical protein P152DRAFT_398484 [Eremomyces bilateralis CBS 781.70]